MARNSLLLDQAVESGEKKKSRKKLIVGLAMLGVIPVVGSTLAASITIGSSDIEFGQGYRAVVACDSNISIVPTATFVNSTTSFNLNTVTVSGIASACNGKTFTVIARDSSGTGLETETFTFNSAGSNTDEDVTFSSVSSASLSSFTLETN